MQQLVLRRNAAIDLVRFTSWTTVGRRTLIVVVHIGFIVFANYLAFWLRFDGGIPRDALQLMITMLPWLVLIRGITFVPLRLYKGPSFLMERFHRIL